MNSRFRLTGKYSLILFNAQVVNCHTGVTQGEPGIQETRNFSQDTLFGNTERGDSITLIKKCNRLD